MYYVLYCDVQCIVRKVPHRSRKNVCVNKLLLVSIEHWILGRSDETIATDT